MSYWILALCVLLGGLVYIGLGIRMVLRHYGPPRPRKPSPNLPLHLFGNMAFLLVAVLYVNRQPDPPEVMVWLAVGLMTMCGGVILLILLSYFLRHVAARDPDAE